MAEGAPNPGVDVWAVTGRRRRHCCPREQCGCGLTRQLPVVQFQAVEGIGAVEKDVALGMDALQLFQGGFASPQTLWQTGAVTKLLQVGENRLSHPSVPASEGEGAV